MCMVQPHSKSAFLGTSHFLFLLHLGHLARIFEAKQFRLSKRILKITSAYCKFWIRNKLIELVHDEPLFIYNKGLSRSSTICSSSNVVMVCTMSVGCMVWRNSKGIEEISTRRSCLTTIDVSHPNCYNERSVRPLPWCLWGKTSL